MSSRLSSWSSTGMSVGRAKCALWRPVRVDTVDSSLGVATRQRHCRRIITETIIIVGEKGRGQGVPVRRGRERPFVTPVSAWNATNGEGRGGEERERGGKERERGGKEEGRSKR